MGFFDKLREIVKDAETPSKTHESSRDTSYDSPQTDGIDDSPPQEEKASLPEQGKKSLKEKLKDPKHIVDIERESTGLPGGMSAESGLSKSEKIKKTAAGAESVNDPTSLINKEAPVVGSSHHSELKGGLENKAGDIDINSGRVKKIVKEFNVSGGLGAGIAEDIEKKQHKTHKTVSETSEKRIKTDTNAGKEEEHKKSKALAKDPEESGPSLSKEKSALPSNTNPSNIPKNYADTNQSTANLSTSSLLHSKTGAALAGSAALGAGAGAATGMYVSKDPDRSTVPGSVQGSKEPSVNSKLTKTTSEPSRNTNTNTNTNNPNVTVSKERAENNSVSTRKDGTVERTKEITDRKITEEKTNLSQEEAKRLGVSRAGAEKEKEGGDGGSAAKAGVFGAVAGIIGGGLARAGIGKSKESAPTNPNPSTNTNTNPSTSTNSSFNNSARSSSHRQYEEKPEVDGNSYLAQERNEGKILYEISAYKRRYFLQFLWTKRHFTISKDGIMKYYRNVDGKRRGEFNIRKEFASCTPTTHSGDYGNRLSLISDKEDELAFDTPEQRDEFLYWFNTADK
ncbi:hypothetical protein NECID01_1454 [Nematocida sp. AWRm77]|nr:hypothetical protein NECID01_1454 [Nematocida sp. AWRm77]